nr:MAG TPA: hypothetical protein [Caudoviricetes sp.]
MVTSDLHRGIKRESPKVFKIRITRVRRLNLKI